MCALNCTIRIDSGCPPIERRSSGIQASVNCSARAVPSQMMTSCAAATRSRLPRTKKGSNTRSLELWRRLLELADSFSVRSQKAPSAMGHARLRDEARMRELFDRTRLSYDESDRFQKTAERRSLRIN